MKDLILLDSRCSLTHQFLDAARMFAEEAEMLEAEHAVLSERLKIRHSAFVTSAVLHAVAALESEAYEVTNHGPGHHRGSNGVDQAARDFLLPIAETLDSLSILDRFDTLLHLTRRPPMDRGALVYQDMALVVRLRNEICHFKSMWSSQLDRQKMVHLLREKRFSLPRFITTGHQFFPHQVLVASCARWSAESAISFLMEFSVHLGFPCRMKEYRGEN